MLPPGIFIWKSGKKEIAVPTDLAVLKDSHPLWASDISKFEPWVKYDGFTGPVGSLLQSATRSDLTIVVTGVCKSTMEVARDLVNNGLLREWGVVISVEQSSGRGQLRRPWFSAPGNIHASIVMPSPPLEGEWSTRLPYLLPLVAGHVFGEVLEGLGAKIQIKWPNDFLQANLKVGGMLIEDQNDLVILGLGLNIAESPSNEFMREDYSVQAGRLEVPNHLLGPLSLLEILVSRGKNVYGVLLDELVPNQFISTAANRLAWLGQSILVQEGGTTPYRAIIKGLSPKGELVVYHGGKETVIYSGSIFPL